MVEEQRENEPLLENPDIQIAVIDGDVLLYKALYAFETLQEQIAGVDEHRQAILRDTGADVYLIYLTGSTNFRLSLPGYKANRKTRPPNYEALKAHMLTLDGVYKIEGAEADDAISLTVRQKYPKAIMCSIDKDLLQIPGYHYRWHKEFPFQTVTAEQAEYNFWIQMLMGDSVDGVTGIPGIGTKTAERLLINEDPSRYAQIVLAEYQAEYGTFVGNQWFQDTYKMLKLLTVNTFRIPTPVIYGGTDDTH